MGVEKVTLQAVVLFSYGFLSPGSCLFAFRKAVFEGIRAAQTNSPIKTNAT